MLLRVEKRTHTLLRATRLCGTRGIVTQLQGLLGAPAAMLLGLLVLLLLGLLTLLLPVVERARSHRSKCCWLLLVTQSGVTHGDGEVVVVREVGGGVLAIHGRRIAGVVVGVRGIVELPAGGDTFFELYVLPSPTPQ